MKILDMSGKEKGTIQLPEQFSETVRKDLIQRVVESIQIANRQPYGAFLGAGKRVSSEVSKRRRDYRGSYGAGISRVPRKVMSRNGTRMNWMGAFMPGTVKGRRAHPPKSYTDRTRNINTKERLLAIRSALSATLKRDIVENRGHVAPKEYPFAITDDFEKIQKTAEAVKALTALGLEQELARSGIRRVRAGRGKRRGRKYKTSKGPLFVVSSACALQKSARNIPGIDIVQIKDVNVELLAPGAQPGRLTLFTEKAIKELKEKKLFI